LFLLRVLRILPAAPIDYHGLEVGGGVHCASFRIELQSRQNSATRTIAG
jgi:hypothetical protein